VLSSFTSGVTVVVQEKNVRNDVRLLRSDLFEIFALGFVLLATLCGRTVNFQSFEKMQCVSLQLKKYNKSFFFICSNISFSVLLCPIFCNSKIDDATESSERKRKR